MNEHDHPASLLQVLDCIDHAKHGRDRVALGEILDAVGRRSFGPLLLVAGLVTLAPVIGDIPGMPTLMACMVLLVAGQLLWRREHFWLPRWLLVRSVSHDALDRGMNWLRPPARYVDRLLRPRLTRLVGDTGVLVIALCCVLIALAMPPMEVIPFSANGAGLALTLFGLALIGKDGLIALGAFVLTFTTFAVIVFHLF